jgi:hypothetical protein
MHIWVSLATLHPRLTNFVLSENPISEGGRWLTQENPGVTNAMATVSGLAFGLQIDGGYDDSAAILSGTWNTDQFAQATVRIASFPSGHTSEVSLHLHMSPTSRSGWKGYEITHSLSGSANGSYILIVVWDGEGQWRILAEPFGSQYGVVNGDIVRAEVRSNVIFVYKNGALEGKWTDSTYPTGAPGMGTYTDCTNCPANNGWGFSNFTGGNLY